MRTLAWPHRFVVRPWSELGAWYEGLAADSPDFTYLVEIVRSVEASDRADVIVATTSMHDLVVADVPLSEGAQEVIIVHAPGSVRGFREGYVLIEHLSHTGRNDEIERPVEEAVRLFWRFANEKWGIVAERDDR
jgi:hypothetical protein